MTSPTTRRAAAFNTRTAELSRSQRIADAITRFSGSMGFVVLHVVWFALWIVGNIVVPRSFDPFPFGLLTLIVSLEAIFLSTFLLISQNRQSNLDNERSRQDLETDLYAEAFAELISERLGINLDRVQERFEVRKSEATSPGLRQP